MRHDVSIVLKLLAYHSTISVTARSVLMLYTSSCPITSGFSVALTGSGVPPDEQQKPGHPNLTLMRQYLFFTSTGPSRLMYTGRGQHQQTGSNAAGTLWGGRSSPKSSARQTLTVQILTWSRGKP